MSVSVIISDGNQSGISGCMIDSEVDSKVDSYTSKITYVYLRYMGNWYSEEQPNKTIVKANLFNLIGEVTFLHATCHERKAASQCMYSCEIPKQQQSYQLSGRMQATTAEVNIQKCLDEVI